jgi:hypothetical protein
MLLRRTSRQAWRCPLRRTVRCSVRTRWRAPDDLGAALTGYRRALRAHRRLAKLAPHFFDSAVVDHDARARESRRQWMAACEAAVEKVYGPRSPAERETQRLAEELANRPLPLLPRRQRAVDAHLAAWNFWLTAASDAMDRYCQRRPHALISFHRLTDLITIGFDLGRVATGMDSSHPLPPPVNYDQAWADLHRAYGDGSNPQPGMGSATTCPPEASLKAG